MLIKAYQTRKHRRTETLYDRGHYFIFCHNDQYVSLVQSNAPGMWAFAWALSVGTLTASPAVVESTPLYLNKHFRYLYYLYFIYI